MPGAAASESDGLIALAGVGAASKVAALDLAGQARAVVEQLRAGLRAIDADLHDLVKLVVAHAMPTSAEVSVLDAMDAALPPEVEVVVTLVPLRRLALPGQLIQVDAFGLRERVRTTVTLGQLDALPAFACHGIACGPFVLTSGLSASGRAAGGALVEQNRCMLDDLAGVLDHLDVSPADVVKANSWRTPTPDPGAYTEAAAARFDFFSASRAAVTGITVPGLDGDGPLTRLDLWAMDPDLLRRRHRPEGHWDWSTEVPYSHGLQAGAWLFIGGQAALDPRGAVIAPDEVGRQVAVTAQYVQALLRSADARAEDVVSMTTWVVGGEAAQRRDEAHQALLGSPLGASLATTGAPHTPAVAVTGVMPVDGLAYDGQVFELDAVVRVGPVTG